MAMFIVKPWYRRAFNPDDYFDPVTHIATESNFIRLLNDGIYDSSLIGYKVQLSNSVNYNNGVWVIADVNHNANQPNTYDLISEDIFNQIRFSSSSHYWRNSDIRTWLNGTFYNGFSADFKAHMNNITYDSNGSIYNDDKIILPSFTEVNGTTATTSIYYVTEGTAYPIFTDNNSRIKKYNGTAQWWWSRSRYTNPNHTLVWIVLTDGKMDATALSNYSYIAPILRVS